MNRIRIEIRKKFDETSATGYCRKAASRRRHGHHFTFAIDSESEAGPDIFRCKIEEVSEDLCLGHALSLKHKYILF